MEMPTGAKTQVIKNTPYVYIDMPYWNSEKKRGDHKRRYVGKLSGDEFSPNANYMRSLQSGAAAAKPEPKASKNCNRKFYGATYLLDQIGCKLGIHSDLKACFPRFYQQIESLCYYLILENVQSLYRLHKWGLTHVHPFENDLPSQRSSELLGNITESAKMEFFKRQAGRRAEKEYLAFDTTSISSYSELIKQVKYGKNKEGDYLPQINLGLLYGEKSHLPVDYRKLASNTADVVIVRNLLEDISFLEMEKRSFVMDCGFYSERNINELMKRHHKFFIGVRCNPKLVSGHRNPAHEKEYERYFDVHETPKRGLVITAKEEVIRQKKKNFEGKLFIQFVALMYLSYIKRQMDEHVLFKNFTMQTLLDELDIIEQYQQPGHESHISELTKKQVALYMAMDVGLPT